MTPKDPANPYADYSVEQLYQFLTGYQLTRYRIPLRIFQLGRRFAGSKPPQEHKEVKADPKVFDGYVGNYQLLPTFVLTVSREQNQLFLQATGQPKFEIFPESERDYFLKAVDAQITFLVDAQGRATELVLHQGGRDQHAKRTD
jgi:hypothetical protein